LVTLREPKLPKFHTKMKYAEEIAQYPLFKIPQTKHHLRLVKIIRKNIPNIKQFQTFFYFISHIENYLQMKRCQRGWHLTSQTDLPTSIYKRINHFLLLFKQKFHNTTIYQTRPHYLKEKILPNFSL
jgi:hypothetical protein